MKKYKINFIKSKKVIYTIGYICGITHVSCSITYGIYELTSNSVKDACFSHDKIQVQISSNAFHAKKKGFEVHQGTTAVLMLKGEINE